jgi:hypothetical protein
MNHEGHEDELNHEGHEGHEESWYRTQREDLAFVI